MFSLHFVKNYRNDISAFGYWFNLINMKLLCSLVGNSYKGYRLKKKMICGHLNEFKVSDAELL